MGSEMCIRDREGTQQILRQELRLSTSREMAVGFLGDQRHPAETCLLYTSDAADERSSVDLGGRRIIKKKKRVEITSESMIVKQIQIKLNKSVVESKENNI